MAQPRSAGLARKGPPQRVLILTPWFPSRPGDRHGNFVHDSAAALASRGLKVSVLVTQPWVPRPLKRLRPAWSRDRLEPETFTGFESLSLVHHLSIPRGFAWQVSEALHDLTVGRRLAEVARKARAELIHAHTEGEAAVAVRVGRELGVPVVVSLHGLNLGPRHLGDSARRRRYGAALAAAGRVVLVGEPLRQVFCEAAGQDDNFEVVFNGAAMPKPPPAPRSFDRGQPLRFVAVANLNEGKGHDLALQALAMAEARGFSDWSFTVAGDGPERARLEALAREFRLDDKVHFLGITPHERVFDILSDADVFLLPSYREAFGVAYVEAMASGLLAIGVRGQGPEAFIRHGESGFLAAPGDSADLAQLIMQVDADRCLAAQMAAAGQASVRSGFTWEAHAEALIQTYAKAAEGPR